MLVTVTLCAHFRSLTLVALTWDASLLKWVNLRAQTCRLQQVTTDFVNSYGIEWHVTGRCGKEAFEVQEASERKLVVAAGVWKRSARETVLFYSVVGHLVLFAVGSWHFRDYLLICCTSACLQGYDDLSC